VDKFYFASVILLAKIAAKTDIFLKKWFFDRYREM